MEKKNIIYKIFKISLIYLVVGGAILLIIQRVDSFFFEIPFQPEYKSFFWFGYLLGMLSWNLLISFIVVSILINFLKNYFEKITTWKVTISIFSLIFIMSSFISPDRTIKKCFSGNCKNGKGKMVAYNGQSYSGEFKQGVPDGLGVLTWPNGDKYSGEFHDGLQTGHGVYTSFTGEQYIGQWKNGKSNGLGKQTWTDGRVYEGAWLDNKMHGSGIMRLPNGKILRGLWENDEFNVSASVVPRKK